MSRRRCRGWVRGAPGTDHGMVTLELALALPVILLVCFYGGWLLRLGQVQAQAQDAARAAARELARGAGPGAAESAARQVLPGASVLGGRSDGTVTVTVNYRVPGPGPLPAREVTARAVTRTEEVLR